MAPSPPSLLARSTASTPPSASDSNETLGPQVVIISSAFAALASLAVAGRIWARKIKRVELGSDDWMAVVALVCHSYFIHTGRSDVVWWKGRRD